jgi:hypothetical protein
MPSFSAGDASSPWPGQAPAGNGARVRQLPDVTLFGLDCVDVHRLVQAATICTRSIEFGQIRLLTSIPVRDSRVILIEPVRSIAEYNNFMIKQLSTEIC